MYKPSIINIWLVNMTSHRGAACSACGVLLAARHGRNARNARNARSRVAKAGAGWSCWFMLEVKAHMSKYVALCSIWPPSTTFNYQTTIFYSVTFCFWILWVLFEAFVFPKRPGLKWFTSKLDGATGKTWNNWNLVCPAKWSNIIALWSCPMKSWHPMVAALHAMGQAAAVISVEEEKEEEETEEDERPLESLKSGARCKGGTFVVQ